MNAQAIALASFRIVFPFIKLSRGHPESLGNHALETGGRLPPGRPATGGAALSSDMRIDDFTANGLKGM
jgi:hypothetical protein